MYIDPLVFMLGVLAISAAFIVISAYHWSIKDRRKDFCLDIINLVDYEKDCLYAVEHGLTPPPVPALGYCNYSRGQMQYIQDNRQQAVLIYKKFLERQRDKAMQAGRCG